MIEVEKKLHLLLSEMSESLQKKDYQVAFVISYSIISILNKYELEINQNSDFHCYSLKNYIRAYQDTYKEIEPKEAYIRNFLKPNIESFVD